MLNALDALEAELLDKTGALGNGLVISRVRDRAGSDLDKAKEEDNSLKGNVPS